MRIFCDTSVLVAASLEGHVHHVAARSVLERIVRGEDVGICSAHSLAETFSVLARMPLKPKLQAADVLAILERNIFPHFVVVALDAEDYPETIRAMAKRGLGGGGIYDLLHVRAANKVAFDRIYTFNDLEWKTLVPEIAELISQPPASASS